MPGDIVSFEAGDKVPADGRLLTAASLQIEEAGLTGESAPVEKDIAPIPAEDVPLADRVNMAFMNTTVTRGRGEMLVTGTGMEYRDGTDFRYARSGRTGEDSAHQAARSADHRHHDCSGGRPGADRGDRPLPGSIRRANVPARHQSGDFRHPDRHAGRGHDACCRMGTQQLAEKGAIVKRLRSVETLGATSAICSDKTGTLTLNQMTARQMVIPGRKYEIDGEGYSTNGRILRVAGEGEPDFDEILMPMALACDAVVSDGEIVGDPTEAALVVLAAKGGIDVAGTRQEFPRIAEVPFDSAYKFMATFHDRTGKDGTPVVQCYVKGAPDVILTRSTTARLAGWEDRAAAGYRDTVLAENDRLASEGLRVMAVASRDIPKSSFDPEWRFDELGAGPADAGARWHRRPAPQRSQGCHSLVQGRRHQHPDDHRRPCNHRGGDCQAARHRGRGDHRRRIRRHERRGAVAALDEIGVVARVAPEDKVRLVDMLKKQNNVVAMTGDGVNDAPALKRADIGVAMGITGTEVTKEAAEMILTDDNFATIVKAVEGGRALYDNLMKYVRFQVGVLVAFIALFVLAGIFDVADGIPLNPLQVLWINFAIDVPIAIGLGFDAATPGLMSRLPRPANASVLPRSLAIRLISAGLIMAITVLAVVAYGEDHYNLAVALTMGVTTLSLCHVVAAITTRDSERSALSMNTFVNRRFTYLTILVIALTVLSTELGILQRILDTVSMTRDQWGISLLATGILLAVYEVAKLILGRTGWLSVSPAQPVTDQSEVPAIAGEVVTA